MPIARTRRLLGLLLAVIGVLAFAGSASASTLTQTPFGCRASVLRATVLSPNLVIEPYVANEPTTPCATDSHGVEQASALNPTNSGTIAEAGPAGAFTYSAFSPDGATAPGATAVANVTGVTIPSATADLYIAGPIQATASYECVNNQVVASHSSTLDLLYINGKATPINTTKPESIPLGNGYIDTNQVTQTANSLTIDLVHVYLPGLLDVVVGEAKVTQTISNPCAGTGNQPPPVLEICPPGSTLNAAAQLCEIHIGGETIVVSRPFRGPSGGTVYALSVARKKYPHAPCLYGAGPKYALIATKQGGRVEGTAYSDRILAVGSYERVAGIGGNDCLQGIGKTERLFDGNGKERIYSAGGRNRIAIGNGNSLVVDGKGSDTVTVGNGNNTIRGGSGNNHIDAGTGRNKINAGTGRNRVFTPGVNAKVNCGPSKHNVAFLRRKAIKYAMAHGCTRVIHLQ
jgi:hypothetical protein